MRPQPATAILGDDALSAGDRRRLIFDGLHRRAVSPPDAHVGRHLLIRSCRAGLVPRVLLATLHPVLHTILTVDPHPLLDIGFVLFESTRPLAGIPVPQALGSLLHHEAVTGLIGGEAVRTAVRDLLRGSGFKPTGRSKPSSEYLRKASEEGRLTPINILVDLCNAASLHSSLPISVVDLDRVVPPLRIGVAAEGGSYVFNAAGQVIDVGNLLCLHDGEGPCANAVKDAQRTKTHAGTTRAIAIVWGTKTAVGQTSATSAWLVEQAQQTELEASLLLL